MHRSFDFKGYAFSAQDDTWDECPTLRLSKDSLVSRLMKAGSFRYGDYIKGLVILRLRLIKGSLLFPKK